MLLWERRSIVKAGFLRPSEKRRCPILLRVPSTSTETRTSALDAALHGCSLDNHLAEIDEARLVRVLKEFQAAGHDVGLAGFTEDEVARLTALEEEIAQLEPIRKMELQAAAAARG